MKLLLPLFFIVALSHPAASQTLFTYGNNTVSKDEFMKAFEKNNTNTTAATREKDIRNYLDLYTRFKLKVAEAYALKLDTVVVKQADVQNFRRQLEEPFMTDNTEIKRLTEEAFNRSQKDIHLAHIFIPFRPEYISNPTAILPHSFGDSLTASKKINDAYQRIMKGEDFGNVAATTSMDPSAAITKGDMGWITVFSLPYSLENAAYSIAPGKVSAPVASSAGFHIFKNIEERPALGKMKVAQILIAFDPSGGPSEKARAKKLADSLYNAVTKGASFEQTAADYSYDKLTSGAGGEMNPVSVGNYQKPFEDAVFSLKKNGDITAPFETESGFHIVKRINYMPVEKNYTEAYSSMKTAVDQDKRANLARRSFEKKVRQVTGMKRQNFTPAELWKYTDSSLKKGKINTSVINENTVLLEFPAARYSTEDWVEYASMSPLLNSSSNYPIVWDEYETAKATEYYRAHLDEFNPEFKTQLKEFMEGNLLFEIMERKVWTVSAADSAGLRKYYSQNKSKYSWQKSADAIMFNTSDSLTAVKNRKQLAAKPASWKKLAAASEGNVLADSGRVELSQIPAVQSSIKPGLITPVVVNEDQTASFSYIVKVYPQPTQRSFNDAKGLVMNDYQLQIEEKWIDELKMKYPVNVSNDVLESIIKN